MAAAFTLYHTDAPPVNGEVPADTPVDDLRRLIRALLRSSVWSMHELPRGTRSTQADDTLRVGMCLIDSDQHESNRFMTNHNASRETGTWLKGRIVILYNYDVWRKAALTPSR